MVANSMEHSRRDHSGQRQADLAVDDRPMAVASRAATEPAQAREVAAASVTETELREEARDRLPTVTRDSTKNCDAV